MNTCGISSNALFGNSANNFFEPFLDAKLLSAFDLLCWLGYYFVFVYAKITDAQCADVKLAGVSKHHAHALIGNVGNGNFRPSFYKKQYLSNGQASCREISHKHCK